MLHNDFLRFFMMGNWGQYHKNAQVDAADCMADIANRVRPQFIITTGDNFYEKGVANKEDILWELYFETVYHHKSLQVPWYAILGHHDHQGNPDAQVAYTYKSRRWIMPKRYYSESCLLNHTTRVLLIFLDTAMLAAPNSAKSPEAIQQLSWLENALQSPADWRIVIGHHAIPVNQRDEPATTLLGNLPLLFDIFQVQAYFSGSGEIPFHTRMPKKSLHQFSVGGNQSLVAKKGKSSDEPSRSNCFLDIALMDSFMQVRMINLQGAVIDSIHVERDIEKRPLVFIPKASR